MKQNFWVEVSYCATCDSFFFKNKDVAIISESDCTATSALVLSDIAKKVYLIYRGEKLKCEDVNQEKLKEKRMLKYFIILLLLKLLGKIK